LNINIETKYNIRDKVYAIAETAKYHDLYRNETHWVLVEDTSELSWNPPIVPLEISRIVINQYYKGYDICYKIQDYYYYEEDMFDNLEDAKEEINKRNN